jgi:hypothetical protein
MIALLDIVIQVDSYFLSGLEIPHSMPSILLGFLLRNSVGFAFIKCLKEVIF